MSPTKFGAQTFINVRLVVGVGAHSSYPGGSGDSNQETTICSQSFECDRQGPVGTEGEGECSVSEEE